MEWVSALRLKTQMSQSTVGVEAVSRLARKQVHLKIDKYEFYIKTFKYFNNFVQKFFKSKLRINC